jgi:hypothetical protein
VNFERISAVTSSYGAIAQLGERVLCKHEVVGSIPSGSTTLRLTATRGAAKLGLWRGLFTQEPKGGAWCPAKPLSEDGQLSSMRPFVVRETSLRMRDPLQDLRAGFLTS